MNPIDQGVYSGVAEVLISVRDQLKAARSKNVDHAGTSSGFGLRTMPRKRRNDSLDSWKSDYGRRDVRDWSNTF
jgi:hypothetical protein